MIILLSLDTPDQIRKYLKKRLKLNKSNFLLAIEKAISLIVVFSLLLDFLYFPKPALAGALNQAINETEAFTFFYEKRIEDQFPNTFPELEENEVKNTLRFTITAYNSEVGQCDATPCITANGFDLCKHGVEDSIATNDLPFGTKVKIPDYFGDRVFVVRDRMNKRYSDRIDVWMLEKKEARTFGVKHATIQVLE